MENNNSNDNNNDNSNNNNNINNNKFSDAGNGAIGPIVGVSTSTVANLRGALHYIEVKNYKFGNETQIKSTNTIKKFALKENFSNQTDMYKKYSKSHWPDAEKLGLDTDRIDKLKKALDDPSWDHGLKP